MQPTERPKAKSISAVAVVAAVVLTAALLGLAEFSVADIGKRVFNEPFYYDYVTVTEPSCVQQGRLCDSQTLTAFQNDLTTQEAQYNQAVRGYNLKFGGIMLLLGAVISGVGTYMLKVWAKVRYDRRLLVWPLTVAGMGLLLHAVYTAADYLYGNYGWGRYLVVVLVIAMVSVFISRFQSKKQV